MSNNIVSKYTKIYEVGDMDPAAMTVDSSLPNITITTQPLNVSAGDTGPIESDPNALLTKENAVAKGLMTGTVSLAASPLGTFEFYDLPDGEIDLAGPSFITTDILMSTLKPTFNTITGSTHIAITIVGRS